MATGTRAEFRVPRQSIVDLASLSRFEVRFAVSGPEGQGCVRTGPDSRTKVAPSRRTTLKVRITVGNARGWPQSPPARRWHADWSLSAIICGVSAGRVVTVSGQGDTVCPIRGRPGVNRDHSFAHDTTAFFRLSTPPQSATVASIRTLLRVVVATIAGESTGRTGTSQPWSPPECTRHHRMPSTHPNRDPFGVTGETPPMVVKVELSRSMQTTSSHARPPQVGDGVNT